MSSIDSVHRNISEGNCRRGIREYLQFLNIALSSLGETISAMHVYYEAHDIDEKVFEEWDALAFKLENGLIKLIRSLQEKKQLGDWKDSFITEEPYPVYRKEIIDQGPNALSPKHAEEVLPLELDYAQRSLSILRSHYSNNPSFHHSNKEL